MGSMSRPVDEALRGWRPPGRRDRKTVDADAGGIARSQRFILLGVTFTRLLSLAELTADVNIGWYRHGFTPQVAVLAGSVFAESTALLIISWVRGSVSRSWAASDAIFMALGLIAFASQATSPFDPWTFMFQFSFTSAMTVGVSFQRLRTVLGWQCVPAGAYAVTALVERNAGWNVPQDLVSYLGLAVVVWALARELRRSGHALDEARTDAVSRESALAVERERSRDLRDLHDRVLQTLEALARGRFIDDERILAQVTRDAFWLRRLVAGAPAPATDGAADLGAALAAVVEDHIAAGLRVRLYTDGIHGQLAAPSTQALAAAVGEALTNVRKHAGVTHAVVRAASEEDGIRVSVLDSGCGFDAAQVRAGTGLRESIGRRLELVGGHRRIDTAAGAGTCIEMWVPTTAGDCAGGT
jgi:signal transduction histidine kinase